MMIQQEQYINSRSALASFICYTKNDSVTFYADTVLATHQSCSYEQPGTSWGYKEQEKKGCFIHVLSKFAELLFSFKNQQVLNFNIIL